MKRLFFVFITASILIACGGSNGKSGTQIAEEVCDCSKKANDLPTSDPNRGLAQNDCLKKQREEWEKLKDDEDKVKDFNAGLAKCAEEQLKKSFGK